MNNFISGLLFGIALGGTIVAINLDTRATSFSGAEAACKSLNSHVESFDAKIATCENTAEINFHPFVLRGGDK